VGIARDLEFASIRFEESDVQDDDEAMKWLNQLLAPGSSLGGARPKAGVVDDQGSLWIAKFPSRSDQLDVGAWESVLHELAVLAGLRVPAAAARTFTCRSTRSCRGVLTARRQASGSTSHPP
jgi:serine/threonine-protein kinase HipA